jgi:hypothetical protein
MMVLEMFLLIREADKITSRFQDIGTVLGTAL